MKLGKQQELFSRMYPILILYMQACGYEVRTGDVWARAGHSKNSFHYKKLAIDINLFKDGKYLTRTEDHEQFGLFWESLGGTWGGRFKDSNGNPKPDGNHYSLFEGKR